MISHSIFRVGLPLLLVSVLFGSSMNHDFWIVPSSFQPVPGEKIDVSVFVGHMRDSTPYTRNPAHIERFVAIGQGEEYPVAGRAGRSPAGSVVLREKGIATVGYRSRTSATELDAERFESYLREEGLAHIIQQLLETGESAWPGKEIFSRCAKAVLQVGGTGVDGFDQNLGFPLEITPVSSPYSHRAGDQLSFRIQFNGEPVVNAHISAVNTGRGDDLTARSDENGIVSFTLDVEGVWLIKTVYMMRAPPEADADWESLWGTLTFELPGS